ncbi:hypothetical protein VKT23_004727 [Stygiomarasmius scandens]|uniref:C2H2-type domain-containing protein n=1 Tax=Marasmiellus scandens TaxID=2682957 RepID=A0ABR1K0Q3_9AGAR
MSSKHFVCSSCKKSWDTPNYLIQHQNKTSNSACREAGQKRTAALRRKSQSAPRRNSPRRQKSPHPSSCQSSSNLYENSDEPTQFHGDFFGPDYREEDFPGFHNNTAAAEEPEDDSDEEDRMGCETTWEPPRAAAFASSAPDDNMDVDNLDLEKLASLGPKPLLQNIPATRDNIIKDTFSGQAGKPLLGSNPTTSNHDAHNGFIHYQSQVAGTNENKWAPFNSQMDWEVARWAKMRGPSSTAFSELLEIDGVYEALGLSYKSTHQLDNIIDTEIPARRPSFSREEVIIAGEAFDLYKRDILECIRALYGAPEHARYLCVVPERHYSDRDKTCRIFHDLYTGRWWWDTQIALEAENPGATIVPIILSSDKTQVTLFRNKTAYPVYLTIGNLPKEIRRKPSHQGQILLAYLPTTKLKHISNKAARRRAVANLFHACMSHLVAPLKDAGIHGTVMQSGDGVKRRCHPILAVYIGDYPEQILVTCGYYGDCPACMAKKDELGIYPCIAAYRNANKAVDAVELIGTDEWIVACLEQNIKPVQHPFWEDLPYTDIFRSITPDILHQLYQGVMKHLVSWLTDICGADEMDARVRRLPPNHGIRQFHKGISSLSRVTGTEHKAMCTFLLGVAVDIPKLTVSQSRTLLTATRALMDFLYLACSPIHTNNTLDGLDEALADFHTNRHIFVDLGVHEHFNLPKLHFLCHYSRAIKLYGTCDNYNTETTERLHIDLTKEAYRASNRKDEYIQMTKWLERREKIVYHSNYIAWREASSTVFSTPAAVCAIDERLEFPGSLRTLPDMRCPLVQKLTTFPTVRSVSLTKLQDTSEYGYGATQFITALREFIARFRHPEYPAWEVLEMAQFIDIPYFSLPVWHKIKFRNQNLYGTKTLDVVCAYPRRFNARNQVTKMSRYDTALIRVRPMTEKDECHYLDGMQVGRVRVIFSLPSDQHYKLFPANMTPPTHLAYVEWFSKFAGDSRDYYSGLRRTKRLVNPDGRPSASVIPIEKIQHSVNLYPKWGGAVPSGWTSETVLDTSPSFLLNPFREIHTYFNLG